MLKLEQDRDVPDVPIREFFHELFGACDGKLIEILKLPHAESTWCQTVDEAVTAVKDDKRNVLFGVALRSGKKGDKEHAASLSALWVDIDAADDERDRLCDRLNSFEHAPSIVHETRRGWHAYWLLREPEAIDAGNGTHIEGMLYGLARSLGGDSCHDISRRLRVPGTMHLKADGKLCRAAQCPEPFRTRIVSWHPHRRYNLGDFEPYFKDVPGSSGSRVAIPRVSSARPDRFNQLIEADAELRRAWNGEREPPGDKSGSGFDAMLAALLVMRHFSDADIASILLEYPCGKGSSATQQYLTRTIARARDLVSEEKPVGPSSQADRLVTLALKSADLFHDQTHTPYARINVEDHHEVLRCRSRSFRSWLSRLLYVSEQKAPGSEGINAALNVLEAKARFDGERRELSNRIAAHDDAIWYDLGDRERRAVRITEIGWEVVANPPSVFARYEHQDAQAEPFAGGKVEDVFKFIRLPNESDRLLLMVYIVSCFVPAIAHPIPVLHGQQGSGKSTCFRVLRRLIDPSAIEVLSFPRDNNELVQKLSHNWACLFDNVSKLTEWQSDTLCRAVSGEGFSKRALFTDDDDVIYSFRRCVGLNGINVVATKPDLLDRAILIQLERIPPSERQTEHVLWVQFEELRPQIVGGVFDVLSRAMALLPTIELDALPRMADFARWGCAIAEALGYSRELFLRAYDENIQEQNFEAIGGHPVASAVMAFMDSRRDYEGRPSDLLAELLKVAESEHIDTKDRLWPKAPNALTRRLNEVKSNLIDAGISVTDGGRSARAKLIRIRKAENTVITVTTVTLPVEETGNDDDDDGNAGISPKVAVEGSVVNDSREGIIDPVQAALRIFDCELVRGPEQPDDGAVSH